MYGVRGISRLFSSEYELHLWLTFRLKNRMDNLRLYFLFSSLMYYPIIAVGMARRLISGGSMVEPISVFPIIAVQTLMKKLFLNY